MYLRFKGNEDEEVNSTLDNAGLEYSYINRWKRYDVKINNFEEYQEHKDLFVKMVKDAKDYLL